MELKPMYDKVVVKQAEAKTKKGNIHLPAQANEKQGTVVAVGPGLMLQDGRLADMPLKVGDEVVFTSYGGNEVELNDEKFLIMSANDVLAVVK